MYTKAPLTTAFGLIDRLHIVNQPSIDSFISELLQTRQAKIIGFLNQHGYNLAAENKAILDSFGKIDYLLRDGIGIKWACRWGNLDPGLNLNGTDFIPSLINQANNANIAVDYFVFGTTSPWLEKGTSELLRGKSAHMLNGFLEDEEYVNFVASHVSEGDLAIIVLAMGMPKQERLAPLLTKAAKGPILVICGGAIIDFQANRFKRAPLLFRRLNLEWLYRFISEPRRLFGRYVVGIPKFLYYLAIRR